MNETFNEIHVDDDLVGAAPVHFRDIDVRQQIQKAHRFPIPAQRLPEMRWPASLPRPVSPRVTDRCKQPREGGHERHQVATIIG